MPQLKIDTSGFDEMLKRLRFDNPIFAEPWREAVRDALSIMKGKVEQRAPTRTGHMRATITTRMPSSPIPLWGVVTTNANNKGVRYPFVLEAGRRKKGRKVKGSPYIQMHYSGTGKTTKRWFKGSSRGMKNVIQGLLDKAGQKIRANWNR